MKKVKVLLLSLAIVFLVAYIGSLFTSNNTNSEWYQSIKPAITPPNFVFPTAWTIIFVLIAVSLYLVWISAKKKDKQKIAIVFGINFLLNILWSYLYFSLRNPLFAFIELIFLWLSIGAMIFITNKVNKTSAYLLLPYLLWVSFAAVLNYLSI